MQATYYAHMGNDDMVCDMARSSMGKRANQYTPEQNARLIRYLARGMSEADQTEILEEAAGTEDFDVLLSCFKRLNAHTHWAPMAHPQITLFVESPIAVARQDFKHIVGFIRSETSRRYVDSMPEFFYPKEWRERPEGSIKQGSGDAHPNQALLFEHYEELLRHVELVYQDFIEKRVAPEQARFVLPQSMYTTYYVTGSLAAWARAYNQRVDSHAQDEIRDLAKQWGNIIKPLFPISWQALTQ